MCVCVDGMTKAVGVGMCRICVKTEGDIDKWPLHTVEENKLTPVVSGSRKSARCFDTEVQTL